MADRRDPVRGGETKDQTISLWFGWGVWRYRTGNFEMGRCSHGPIITPTAGWDAEPSCPGGRGGTYRKTLKDKHWDHF